MKPFNVADRIYDRAEKLGLMVDRHRPPMKVASDVYIIEAVAKTEACQKWGGCEQHLYYAFPYGPEVVILNQQGDRF